MFLSIYSFAPWLAPQQHCTENHFMHKGRKSENKFARARARERERERERCAKLPNLFTRNNKAYQAFYMKNKIEPRTLTSEATCWRESK
jgi:hypothetical protein